MDHKALLRAVEASDRIVFLKWYEDAQSQNYSSVKEAVDRVSQKELSGIWTVFSQWIKEDSEQIKNPSQEDGDIKSSVTVVSAMAAMASHSLDNVSSTEPPGLKVSILTMNSLLPSLSCKKTALSICELCEKYWKIHPELTQNLVSLVIEWLITSNLNGKGGASVKYLWSLKDAIKRLDWNTLENSTLLKLCLLCTRDFKFIQNPDGRKFIACLFTLDPNLVQLLHQSVKKNLPLATTAESELYGEIYFRAWRHSPENCIKEIESTIQDLMYSAVVASRKPLGAIDNGINKVAMNKLLFHFLHALHRQKKQRTVAIMIGNLYKPILWRYLEATNGYVRTNALCLFFDAFPFESGEGLEEDEALRVKQWNIILTTLMDPVPLVRSIAVQGTCQVLTEYWDLIPVNIIQEFITCMFRKLLYDSSSPDVRTSVVKGMCSMLDNKQTHALLEKMVPLTSKVLHDINEKVRAEYVSLLTRIQSLRVSKLWEVIDMNHLVVRLAVDPSKNVCRRLVILLAPFYNPKSQPEIVLQRCLRLVMDNRTASRKFYDHVHCCSDIQQIAQLILVIWKFLRNFALKQLHENRTSLQREEAGASSSRRAPKRSRRQENSQNETQRNPDDDKENQAASSESEHDEDIEEDDASDEISESTILGLIDVVCVLLSNNKSKMKTPPNMVYWKNILQRFNKSCSLFFRYFRNSDGLRSVIYMYGLLSSNSSPIMLTFVKSQLKSLDDRAAQSEYAHLLDALCNWGRGDDILEFVTENIQSGLAAAQPTKPAQKSKGSRKKSVQFEASTDEKPILGLNCMLYVLQNVQSKKMLFRQNLGQVEDLCNTLKPMLAHIESRSELLTSDNPFNTKAALLYTKLVCVLASSYGRGESDEAHQKHAEFQEQVMEILNWIERLILSDSASEPLVSSIIKTVHNLLIVHSVGSEVCQRLQRVLDAAVECFSSSSFLVLTLTSAYLCLDFTWVERSVGQHSSEFNQSDPMISQILTKLLNRCILTAGDRSFTSEELLTMREAFREILTLCQRYDAAANPSLADIVACLVAAMESEIKHVLFQENPNEIKSVKDLPQITQTIVIAFRARNKVAQLIFAHFYASLGDCSGTGWKSFHCFLKLIQVVVQDQGKISTATLVESFGLADQFWTSQKNTDIESNDEGSNIQELLKETKLALKLE